MQGCADVDDLSRRDQRGEGPPEHALAGGRRRARPQRLAASIHQLVMAAPPLRRAAVRLSRLVEEAPGRSPIRTFLGPLRATLRGEVRGNDLLRILDALDAAGIGFWLAGGWGVDALVGRQTRRHDDVDLVIDDFGARVADACTALGPLGFDVLGTYRYALWMPDRWLLRDGALRMVDLLSIDWPRLADALGLPAGAGLGELSAELRSQVFSEGVVGGRTVPCLSARVQLLYHSGFAPRSVHHHDVALLHALLDT
jgi:lincosamide nucleotidyltransferase A/C/D/E